MKEHLELFCASLNELSEIIENRLDSKKLQTIGIVTSGDLAGIAAYYLTEEDFSETCDLYLRYSAVEWPNSEGDCFKKLSNILEETHFALRRDIDYKKVIRDTFDLCIDAMKIVDLRNRFGEHLFITFASVDPNNEMLLEEERFVEIMNPPLIYSNWKEELS